MPAIIALIPARSGSKGVPSKNIRKLGDRPLIEWSIAACKATDLISRTIVSTDSEDYACLSKKLGAEVPFLRPKEISGDDATDYHFIKHALDWLAAEGEEPEYIAHVRPTTPFRCPLIVEEAITTFIKSSRATALRSVHEMSESAYKTFEIARGGQLKQIASDSTELDRANNARHEYPRTYVANGYIDVLSKSFIRETQKIHGDHVMPFITPVVDEIDTEEDFLRHESQLEKNPQLFIRLFG